MRLNGIKWLVLCCSLCLGIQATAEDWTPEFLAQTRKANCILGNIKRNVTFLHGTDSGNFKKLGKVADMDVCALLCCEMDSCQAAFMANRNCFAVDCHSREHCATAPAHKNKYHPAVVFIQKIAQKDKTLKNDNEIANSIEDIKDNKEPTKLRVTSNEGLEFSVESSDETKGLSKEKNNLTKEPAVVSNDVKHTKIEKPIPEILDTITGKEKEHTVKMAEKKVESGMEEHQERRERKLKQSRDSLVSAAVVTCSVAFLLSFAAMVAAKIRRTKDTTDNPDYTTLPGNENTEAVQ